MKTFLVIRRLLSLKTSSENTVNDWLKWIKSIGIALIIAFLLKSFIFSTSIVEGESMAPALNHGNKIIINKFVYLVGKPARNDIVIIQRPLKNYVKRVIGLPGEKIQMIDHILYIDDEIYDEPFIKDDAKKMTGNFGPIIIPKNNYYVIGDNRAISKDSRNGLGLIEEANIIGRSEFIIYPFNEWALTK